MLAAVQKSVVFRSSENNAARRRCYPTRCEPCFFCSGGQGIRSLRLCAYVSGEKGDLAVDARTDEHTKEARATASLRSRWPASNRSFQSATEAKGKAGRLVPLADLLRLLVRDQQEQRLS